MNSTGTKQKKNSIQIDGIHIDYVSEEAGVILTGASRLGSVLNVPERIDGRPVTEIAKKAFLGQNNLRQVYLPQSVVSIGEWAFSHCINLEVFSSMASPEILALQRGVFTGCKRLTDICMGGETRNDLSALLAATASRMEAEYLINDLTRGSLEWYQKWDRKLIGYLGENDEEGYMKLALCGEEDIMLNIPEYITEKRKQKAALCMIRLRFSEMLSQEMEQLYKNYLLTKTKGCKTEEAWQALVNEFISDISYLQMFSDIGGITAENLDEVLLDLGDGFAEAKAFLMRYKETHFQKTDVFDSFVL